MLKFHPCLFVYQLQCERFDKEGCKGNNTEKCEKIEKFCDCVSDVSAKPLNFNEEIRLLIHPF